MAAGGGVEKCICAALEDVLHDVGQWFLWVYLFRLLVRVRNIGAAVVAMVDGVGHVGVIGG